MDARRGAEDGTQGRVDAWGRWGCLRDVPPSPPASPVGADTGRASTGRPVAVDTLGCVCPFGAEAPPVDTPRVLVEARSGETRLSGGGATEPAVPDTPTARRPVAGGGARPRTPRRGVDVPGMAGGRKSPFLSPSWVRVGGHYHPNPDARSSQRGVGGKKKPTKKKKKKNPRRTGKEGRKREKRRGVRQRAKGGSNHSAKISNTLHR